MQTKTLFMGGTANFRFVEPAGGYIIAMSGSFEGGAFARVIGEPQPGKNGQLHLVLEHYFIHRDGSTLRTNDRSVLTEIPGESRRLAATTYQVVEATGAFKDLKGQFQSWGSIDPVSGEGVLRFTGELAA